MQIRIILFFTLLSPLLANSQAQQVDPVINGQFGYIKQIPVKPAGVTGSVYLNDEWKRATLKLKSGALNVSELPDVSIKLDLKTNTFELNVDASVKILGGTKVESFVWENEMLQTSDIFINCEVFTFDDTKVTGFGRVLSHESNGLTLLEHYYVEFMQADYNVALNVGSKDAKYVKKDKLYFVKDNKMILASKKSIYEVMADKESAIKKFIKENDVNLKKGNELAKVVEYYNSI